MSSSLEDNNRLKKDIELHGNWRIPSIAQFVSLFSHSLKLPEIEIEDLEEGLIGEVKVQRSIMLELLVALLHGMYPKANAQNWDFYLQKFLKREYTAEKGKHNPYTEQIVKRATRNSSPVNDDTHALSFLDDTHDTSLNTFLGGQSKKEDSQIDSPFWNFETFIQVDIIHTLCLIRIEYSDAQEALKKMDADALRVQPLGCDDLGNEYWYFYGTRLYKQEPPADQKSKNWEQEWKQQKEKTFQKRGRGRPRKIVQKTRKSDGESDDFEDVDSNKNKRFMNIDERSRWSVVCNTIEDWVNFAEKFKDSKSKCEKQLFETVKGNFLPALNEIYQEKERRLKEKLKELIQSETRNQRTNIVTRRETRRQKKNSHESALSNEYEYDNAHKEHLSRSRAKRLEERNRRINEGANLRSTRKRRRKYSSDEESEELEESEVEDISENYEKNGKSEESSRSSDEFVMKCHPLYSDYGKDVKAEILKLLSEVKSHKDAWPFLHPVEKKDAPGYYEIISQPIDLSTITQKLLDGTYQTVSKLVSDFNKLVSNCRLYNGENSPHTRMANTIFKLFQKRVAKIINSKASDDETDHTETFMVTSKYSHTRIISKKGSNTLGGKKKRKIHHMDALEVLSRESELAVEKSNSNSFLESLQLTDTIPKGITSFTGLKVVPIHSHPTELIEKFLSEPSSEETEKVNNCNDNSKTISNHAGNSSPSSQNNDIHPAMDSAEDDYYVSQHGNESPDLSVFANDCQSKSFEETGVEVNSAHDETVENYPVRSVNNSPKVSQPDNYSNNSEVLMHGSSNILDECNNQNVSSLMSGFNREPLYSANEANTSPSAVSPYSRRSNTISPEQVRESSRNSTSSFIKNPVVEKHVPFLQDGLSLQSGFTNFSSSNEPSTVDASVLGFSSFSNMASVSTNSSNELGNKQTMSTPPQISTTATTFTTHISPSTNSQEASVTQFSSPLQVNVPYEKVFSYQNPIQICKPEPNKFPALKVSLPPSTGELVVLPDKTDPNKMTLHLLAQPHISGSQPIQSCVTIRSNNNSGSPTFQAEKTMEMTSGKENPSVVSSRQQSPISDSSQFQIGHNGLFMAPSQPLEKTISGSTGLLTIPSTFSGFTSNTSNPLFSSTYANSFIPVSTTLTAPVPTTRSDYNVQTSAYDTSTRPSNDIYMNSESGNRFHMLRTTSSCLRPTSLPYYQIANNNREILPKPTSVPTKHTANTVKKVYTSNEPFILNSNNLMSNNTGLYETISLPKENMKKNMGSQQVTGMISSDKQYQQNAKSVLGAIASPYYSSMFNNTLQNYTFNSAPMNPPLVYTQVNPSQPSQFINVPNYMMANQNLFQYPLNHPVLNMQPFHVPNRPVLSMDLVNR